MSSIDTTTLVLDEGNQRLLTLELVTEESTFRVLEDKV